MTAKSKAGGSLGPGTGMGNEGSGTGPGAERASSQEAKGQEVSRERGSATRSKKNPGKRATQGGGAR